MFSPAATTTTALSLPPHRPPRPASAPCRSRPSSLVAAVQQATADCSHPRRAEIQPVSPSLDQRSPCSTPPTTTPPRPLSQQPPLCRATPPQSHRWSPPPEVPPARAAPSTPRRCRHDIVLCLLPHLATPDPEDRDQEQCRPQPMQLRPCTSASTLAQPLCSELCTIASFHAMSCLPLKRSPCYWASSSMPCRGTHLGPVSRCDDYLCHHTLNCNCGAPLCHLLLHRARVQGCTKPCHRAIL